MYSGGGNKSTGQETTPSHGHADPAKPTNINTSTGPPTARLFSDLPLDVLYRIASKLPPKEFARTSILSSEWRRISCSACPKLTFDAAAMSSRSSCEYYFSEYINEVYAVLQKHQNKVVEALQIRIGFVDTTLLARHIDAWVDFAVSSRTKSLVLDLKPQIFWWKFDHRYVFPFQLFDPGSISRLQDMQLSFVSFSNPPPWFKGFPNLKRLYLQMLRDNTKDLEHVLSFCRALEWLHIDRCNLDDDELTVDTPLSHLTYLRVEWCRLTKIRFNAVNLAIFEYDGNFIPIYLESSFKLKSANIEFNEAVFQHALISLLNGLPGVQNLTLKIGWTCLEKQWLWDNPLKFSNLRHLQLTMIINSQSDDKILYSVSFLRATPFVEKLEIHFVSFRSWFAQVGPCRKDLGQCKYNYLKDIWITGFNAARGEVEFLLHVVENAPALEVVLVQICKYPPDPKSLSSCESPIEAAKQIATTCLCTTLPQNVPFDVIE